MLRIVFAIVALVLSLACPKRTPAVPQTPEPNDPVEGSDLVEDGAR